MFISAANFFLNRNTSIKDKKLVGEVVKHLGVSGESDNNSGISDSSGSTTKQNGLTRIRVRDLHDDWPDEALPIFQMKEGFGSGNSQGTTDEFKQLPPVGSKVYVSFPDNSQYFGEYFSGPASDDKKIDAFTNSNDYGKTYGRSDVGGNLIKTSTDPNNTYMQRTHVTGANELIDKTGSFLINALKDHVIGAETHSVKTDKNHTIDANGDANWKIAGDLIISVGGKIKLQHGGATTNLPINLGGGSPDTPSSRTKPQARQRPTFTPPGEDV